MTTNTEVSRLVSRSAEPKDLTPILDLLRGARFLPRSPERAREVYDWKHRQSPEGASLGRVAEIDGEVVGYFAAMPRRLFLGDRGLRAFVLTDGCVRPGWHRRGLLSAGIGAFLDTIRAECDFVMTLPGRTSGRRLFMNRLGWKIYQPMDALVATWGARRKYLRSRDHCLLTALDKIGDDIDGLLRPSPDDDCIRLVTDHRFLRWRFLSRPDRTYRVIGLRCQSEIVGLAITRPGAFVGVDLILASWATTHHATALVDEVLRERGSPLKIAMGTPSNSLLREMERAGGIKLPMFALPRRYAVLAEPLSASAQAIETKKPTWDATIGDIDAA